MTVHELKIYPTYFEEVLNGNKTFEVRINDRNYHTGDVLVLKEFDGKGYTGRILAKKVTYILKGGSYGLNEKYCIMAIADEKKDKKNGKS